MIDDLERQTGPPRTARLVAAIVAAGAAAAVGWLVLRAQSPPRGVRPIIWDQQTCEHCRMAISEPPFAAQLQAEDGRVLDFDDPGCLFQYQAKERPAVRATYFHAMEGDDWLPGGEAAFVAGVRSPMGHGLGAVRRGTPGALSREQAAERVLGEPVHREGP